MQFTGTDATIVATILPAIAAAWHVGLTKVGGSNPHLVTDVQNVAKDAETVAQGVIPVADRQKAVSDFAKAMGVPLVAPPPNAPTPGPAFQVPAR